ncbi:MAG: hypothetical protein ACE5G2_08815 [Candidatus Krumholzibacteriia bacterium]
MTPAERAERVMIRAARASWIAVVLSGTCCLVRGEGSRAQALYFTAENTIKSAELDGTGIRDLIFVSPFNGGLGVFEVEPAEEKIYWGEFSTLSNRGLVIRSDLDGSNLRVILDIFGPVSGFALDAETRTIYWTFDDGPGRIHRAGFGGANVETVVDSAGRRLGRIVLDLVAGKMYWTVRERQPAIGKIMRANLNGQDTEEFVTGLQTPWDMRLHPVRRELYWTDGGKIQRADLSDGWSVETVITGTNGFCGIGLDLTTDKLYWADSWAGEIHRANLDGSQVEPVLTGQVLLCQVRIGPSAEVSVERTSWSRIKSRFR